MRSIHEDSRHVKCDAMSLCHWYLTFQRITVLSSLGSSCPRRVAMTADWLSNQPKWGFQNVTLYGLAFKFQCSCRRLELFSPLNAHACTCMGWCFPFILGVAFNRMQAPVWPIKVKDSCPWHFFIAPIQRQNKQSSMDSELGGVIVSDASLCKTRLHWLVCWQKIRLQHALL